MKKIENIQSRKVMSAYGGVRSIIETAENGSLLIDFYEQWNCFKDRARKKRRRLEDSRLLKRLNGMDGYEHVASILEVPTPDLDEDKYEAKENDLKETIMTSYFPSWFYCPNCRRLHQLSDWKTKWEEKFPDDGKFTENFPACYHCSNKKGKKNYHRKSLEQVRFLLASADSGQIVDVPFKEIWVAKEQKGKFWLMDGLDSTAQELFYRSSSSSDGLQSIYVQEGKNGRTIYLSEIASKYIVYGKGKDSRLFRLCLRNQNNIYYPEVINSLFIPFKDIEPKIKNAIISLKEKGNTIPDIYKIIQENDFASDDLKRLSENEIRDIIDRNLDYDAQEFAYIINPSNYDTNTLLNFKDNDFKAKKFPNIKVPFVKCMYSILRLKMTSVLPNFSRISTSNSRIQWLKYNEDTQTYKESEIYPKQVKTYSNGNGIDFIPGVESFGEGVFFEMDVKNINEEERAVFVHTYSHMIMKELEFQCGYPLSSMKEKLYSKNNEEEWGILIYTIGGAEGSYGGLVSLFPSDATSDGKDSDGKVTRIVRIIKYAMERVKDCPNDPICSDEGGHCYACLDIPEISCCKWNQELNRNVFIKNKEKWK